MLKAAPGMSFWRPVPRRSARIERRVAGVGTQANRGSCSARTRVFSHNSIWSRKSWNRSEEHTSELQSLMRNSYAVFCLKKKKYNTKYIQTEYHTTHKENTKIS